MNFLKYQKIGDNLLEFIIDIPTFIQEQPKSDEECLLITIALCGLIDHINTEYKDCRQVIVFNCLGSHIKQIKNISYIYYIVKEIHKYTKDQRLLDKITVTNYGESLYKFYLTAQVILPDYINNLIEFRKNE